MSKIKELFKNKTNIYGLVFFIGVLIISIGLSYSYYRTSMTGTNGSLSIKSATINGVTFAAESLNSSSDILPGWSSGAKTITVSVNNTDYDIPYECTLNVSSNDITDMYLFVSGTNAYTANNGVPVVSGAMRLTSEGAKLTSSTKSTSMTYELKYKETGTDQSSQEGKTLSATVTCSLDGVNKLYYSNGSTGVRAIAYDSDGNPVTVTIETVEDSEELKEAVSTNASSLGLTSEQASGAKVIGIDATVPSGSTATVKIAVSDVASTGETVALLHYDETNSAWEKVGDYVVDENGEITVTGLTSFSPFALVNKGVVSLEKNLASLIISKSTDNTDGVYNENGYRYEGSDPNNYITLHNSSTDTDEMWRIIGVFPDGTDGENVIRVRKYYAQNSYPAAAYDHGSTAYNYNGNINISENALAYNDILAAIPTPDAPEPTLDPTTATYTNYWPDTSLYSILSNTYNTTNYEHTLTYKLYLGASSSYSSYASADLYEMERGLNSKGYASNSAYALTYNASVGLIYPSDYGYAVLSNDCARTNTLYSGYSSTSTCYSNNWLYQGSSQYQWLMTPIVPAFPTAFSVFTTGDISSNYFANASLGYSPVMSLENTVTVTGTGTISDPYVITN